MKSNVVKKVLKVSGWVLTYLFIALCLFAVILTLTGKKSEDGATTIFGRELRIVTTDSMAHYEGFDTTGYDIGSIPTGSMVFVERVPQTNANEWYATLKVGDVLTFRYTYGAKQYTITHRLVDIKQKQSGGYILTLKGDNKASENSETLEQTIDTSIESGNYVIGKVTGQSRFLGFVVSAVSSTVGLICIVIIPCAIIIVYEVVKIVSVLNKDKKKKEKDEKQQMSNEIELLKKQIEQLKKTEEKQENEE